MIQKGAGTAFQSVLELWTKGDFNTLEPLVNAKILNLMKSTFKDFENEGTTFDVHVEQVLESNIDNVAVALTQDTTGIRDIYVDMNLYCIMVETTTNSKTKTAQTVRSTVIFNPKNSKFYPKKLQKN